MPLPPTTACGSIRARNDRSRRAGTRQPPAFTTGFVENFTALAQKNPGSPVDLRDAFAGTTSPVDSGGRFWFPHVAKQHPLIWPTRTVSPGACVDAQNKPVSKKTTFGVSPILAVFEQATSSTTYSVKIANDGGEVLTTQWQGPNCGDFAPSDPSPPDDALAQTSSMKWSHPHPPCDETPNHADKTVQLTVRGQSGVIVCEYQGAATGGGPSCKEQ